MKTVAAPYYTRLAVIRAKKNCLNRVAIRTHSDEKLPWSLVSATSFTKVVTIFLASYLPTNKARYPENLGKFSSSSTI